VKLRGETGHAVCFGERFVRRRRSLVAYRITPFVLCSVFLLSGCWETTQCLTGPDAAGRACYEQELREAEDCEQQRPDREEKPPPDYERYE
jgi:hypothetical protein